MEGGGQGGKKVKSHTQGVELTFMGGMGDEMEAAIFSSDQYYNFRCRCSAGAVRTYLVYLLQPWKVDGTWVSTLLCISPYNYGI